MGEPRHDQQRGQRPRRQLGRQSANFYVANYANPNVTEYDASGNLTTTYSAGIADAVDVTTDKVGNVYEADYNYPVSGGGYVNEYAQGSNTVAATCSPGGNVVGVAVDKHGTPITTILQAAPTSSSIRADWSRPAAAARCFPSPSGLRAAW